jgi:flagellar motor switch/type III secretory pathway protein FliN
MNLAVTLKASLASTPVSFWLPTPAVTSSIKKLLSSALDESFGELGNVPVEISAELGQATLDLVEWLNLKEGTLVSAEQASQ